MAGSQIMVVLIIAIVMIAQIVKRGMRHEEKRMALSADPEAERLRGEVAALKDRLAVLERIATDRGTQLDREIEALRGPDERLTRALRDRDGDFRRNHADTREG